MEKIKKETIPAGPVPVTFSKNKLLSFKQFANRVDLLGALLESDKNYTLEEVDSLIVDFMKGRMN